VRPSVLPVREEWRQRVGGGVNWDGSTEQKSGVVVPWPANSIKIPITARHD
jgi:hypothetical protein